MIALNPKTYFGFGGLDPRKSTKIAAKEVNKRLNNLQRENFMRVLTDKDIVLATNRGFRRHDGRIATYELQKQALSYTYIKRKLYGPKQYGR